MEKLIELLNEYGKEHFEKCTNSENELRIRKEICTEAYDEEIIISKRFGFIKRLVDNDKIGDNKNSDRYTIMKLMRTEINEGTVFEGTERYEFVIMILSIQDKPIEFLISILK